MAHTMPPTMQPTMQAALQPAHDEATATEARHVAEEAIEAAEHGDMKEARFLAQEAQALDPDAAREVLDRAELPAGEMKVGGKAG